MPYRQYQRTAHRRTSPVKCRPLKSFIATDLDSTCAQSWKPCQSLQQSQQQGVNWSFAACSSSVMNRSRWSGSPCSTRVTHVPQMPCSHETGISTPFAARISITVLSGGMRKARSEEHTLTPVTNAQLVCRLLLE